jgi:SpoVK/Ycf46/Vps4 family AAA+-type ATPase
VEISQSKSMWFGESEKLVKKIFRDYIELHKMLDLAPILLFNEADAILSSRKTNSQSSVSQTENAIQNILLEEL